MQSPQRNRGYADNKLLIGLAKGLGWSQKRTAEWTEQSTTTVEKWWNDDWVKWVEAKVRAAVAGDQSDYAEKPRAEIEGELKRLYLPKTFETIEKGLDHKEWGPNQWAASAVLDRVVPKT